MTYIDTVPLGSLLFYVLMLNELLSSIGYIARYYYYYYYYHHHHRISHFSGFAGKYSPILGCSNQ